MTLEEANILLWPHGLMLVYLPTSAPECWVILPHPLHPLGVTDQDLGEYAPEVVARGADPELAVAAWRAGLADHN